MTQMRAAERRTLRDRRRADAPDYDGPERRKRRFRRTGFDRRKGWPPVCVHCGKVCGPSREWIRCAATTESTAESLVSLCTDCSMKRFPQFYTDD